MDAGLRTLEQIHVRLLIDEEWTDRRERGFTWWAHRLAQQVDAGPLLDDDGIIVSRVASRIPILRGVTAEPALVEAVLAEWNFIADSYCYVYDPVARTVDSVQGGIVHEQTLDWRPELLAAAFIVQLCHAEEDAPMLRRVLGGRIATSRHPTRGRRREPDDMLNVVWAVFRPRGVGESPFANKFEFDTIYEQVQRTNSLSFGADVHGLAIEVPFGTGTALIQLNAKDSNPRIGAGLGVFVQLPTWASFEDCAHLAAWLNRKEAGGDILAQCCGAWTVKRHGDRCTVARCEFMPAAVYRSGLAMDAAAAAIMRLKRVNGLMNPGVPEPVVWKVVAERMGVAVPAAEGTDIPLVETAVTGGLVS